MQGLIIIVICISPFVSQVLSQCNRTRLEQCMEMYMDAMNNAPHVSNPDFQSSLKAYCSPSVKNAIACYTHEFTLCPDYPGNGNAEIRSYLHDIYVNSTSYINTYCSTMENLSSEFIACLRKMVNDTINRTPGDVLECLFSNPLYNASLTAAHPITNLCRSQEVGYKCGIQYIKQHCPDQMNDYNNYYHVSSGGIQCPDASVMTPIVG